MRIAIEALGISRPGGARSSILSLLQHLFALDTQNEYLVVLSHPEPSLETPAGNVRQWIAPVQNRFGVRLWAQASFPTRLRRYDLVHFTKNLDVAGVGIPRIITIHDLTILVYPEHFPASDNLYWRSIEKVRARSAEQLIAVSKNTAEDLTHFYHIPSSKIRVIYHGVGDHFRPSLPGEVQQIRQVYKVEGPYLLYVGRIDVRKNLTGLVRAFDIARRTGFSGKLVIAGEEYRKCPDRNLVPTIQQLHLEEEVILTGAVPDAHLPALYSGACAFVLPSLHEGFGMGTLEAMACGTPVLTHPSSAVEEVVGDAAVLVDACQTESLAHGILQVVGDSRLRQDLQERGFARARQFRWESAAVQTLEVYQEVAARAGKHPTG